MTPASEVLILTGAAGAGKSTVFAALSGRVEGICAIDGDTLAAARENWDYGEFWAFVMGVCADILANKLVPVICGIGLPSQFVPAADDRGFAVDALALVCGGEVVRHRIATRGYGNAWKNADRHVAVDRELRAARVPSPHRLRTFDTSVNGPEATAATVIAWAGDAVERVDPGRWPRVDS